MTLKAKNILNELSHSDMRAQEGLRADLFDIFSDKITKEGKLIAKSTHSVGDCTQDLFVNFFESKEISGMSAYLRYDDLI